MNEKVSLTEFSARSYIDILKERIEDDTDAGRGEKRKHMLMLAAAEILQGEGFHNLSIAKIVKQVGAARGTFYIYFENKIDIALQVLSDFRNTLLELYRPQFSVGGPKWNERIFFAEFYYADLHEKNSGLLRSFYQLHDVEPDFRKLRFEREKNWHEKQYKSLIRHLGEPKSTEEETELRQKLHGLRAMSEELCKQIYIEQMPNLIELFPTPHHIARTTSALWESAFVKYQK
ncbi:TetR/AcrR family transcriptional regulator [Sneathiella aquimaris]|uniref:TetR/AcrR family transcriptional regulator n=1 Tax=Sneathiella aquimaris TaxID=2599305 RepID=UPI00146E7D89|nr:TetR/AcrR family transcriptional regulator [Sneathiella aquimaris]